MRLQSSLRWSTLLVPAVCLTLQVSQVSTASANACKGDHDAARWIPQRAWPSACASDAATDGLVMLDGDAIPYGTEGGEGELRIFVERMVTGAPVEKFEGKLTRPDATSALFASDRPFAPHADYQITAVHVALDGSELGSKYTSAFTTGEGPLPALSFAGTPTLRYEEAETERFECVIDECGDKHCQAGDDVEQVKSVRVAVPSILGGVDVRPYSVSAKLVATFADGQAPVVATSDTAATQAGKRSFLVVEVPSLPTSAQGCVTITATDAAGHTLSSEPVCTRLPGEPGPYDKEVSIPVVTDAKALSDRGFAQTDEAATETDISAASAPETAAASAQGCTIGQTQGSAGNLGWLAVALTVARLSLRKRVGKKALVAS